MERRVNKTCLRWLAAAAWVACAASGARADAPRDGARLAATIEATASAEERAPLLEALDALPAAERHAFVTWAHAERAAGRPWRRLGPALARLATTAAARELGVVARGRTEVARDALRALGSMPPQLAVPELLRALEAGSRAVRSQAQAALAGLIAATPDRALPQLEVALTQPGLEDAPMADALAEACVTTSEPRHLLDGPVLQARVALGLVRGLARRAIAEAEDEQLEREEAEARRASYAARVERLLEAFEGVDVVLAEALRGLPALLPAVDETWAPRLLDGLEHPSREVRDAAWRALCQLSRQELLQSRPVWERWWRRASLEGPPIEEPAEAEVEDEAGEPEEEAR